MSIFPSDRQLFSIAYYNNKEEKIIEDDITWRVSNNNVNISSAGLVYATSTGTVDITVEHFDGIVSQAFTLEVYDRLLTPITDCATENIIIKHNGVDKKFSCPQYDPSHGNSFYEFGNRGSYFSYISRYKHSDAVNYCNALGSGYRLPTLQELQVLLGTVSIDYSSISKQYGFYFYYGWPVSLPYWTSSRPNLSSNYYFLYMRDGRTYSVAGNADEPVYVSCVKQLNS